MPVIISIAATLCLNKRNYLAFPALNLTNGLTVYQANAGKKIIGTERPGNNSGFFIFNGNETEIGIITIAKEMIENKKLKTISPLLFKRVVITQ